MQFWKLNASARPLVAQRLRANASAILVLRAGLSCKHSQDSDGFLQMPPPSSAVSDLHPPVALLITRWLLPASQISHRACPVVCACSLHEQILRPESKLLCPRACPAALV